MKVKRIVHFMRDRRSATFSIERLYEDVRQALPPSMEAVEWVCRNPSRGFLPRLLDAWAARRAQGDVNHVTGDTHYLTYFLNKRRTALTVHDMVLIERSNGLSRLVFWFFWYWIPVTRSRVVITVSEATRDALLKSIHCDPGKVVVIPNPVSLEFQPSPKVFNDVYPRILQVGTTPNKNIIRVAEALEAIRCRFVVIGKLSQEQREFLAKYNVEYENYAGLIRTALLLEYIKSDIVIFASTYEGFGLPIIEANAVGRPVVTSRLPPMTEVANGAAHEVNPFDASSIRTGIEKIINDEIYRDKLIAAGYKNAQRFSIKCTAEKYASIYWWISN